MTRKVVGRISDLSICRTPPEKEKPIKSLFAVLALTLASSANAFTRGTPLEYDGLQWSFSFDANFIQANPTEAAILGSCSLQASVISTFTANALGSVNYSFLGCGANFTGNAVGTFVPPTFTFTGLYGPPGTGWNCQVALPSLNGSCTIFNVVGTIYLTLVP